MQRKLSLLEIQKQFAVDIPKPFNSNLPAHTIFFSSIEHDYKVSYNGSFGRFLMRM